MAARKKNSSYRLKLPADSANLVLIRQFVSGIAMEMGFDEDGVDQIQLAVDEACANVVKHAYSSDNANGAQHLINVTVRKKADKIEITVADKGSGFNADGLQSPDMDEYLEERKKGGLGGHLIRTFMDKVTFRMQPGIRNEVKMIKFLQK